MKTALALRHVHFEDLGIFQQVLSRAEYRVNYFDIGVHDIATIDPLEPDLLFLLGAPFGVYERDTFPFVLQQRSLLRRRMKFQLPTVGICLGAQQIAAARGAKVTPSGFKEIGLRQFHSARQERTVRCDIWTAFRCSIGMEMSLSYRKGRHASRLPTYVPTRPSASDPIF